MAEAPKPPQRAAALSYERGVDAAPRVVAAGQGEIAARIVSLAQSSGVPTIEDPALAGVLTKLELGQEIPRELYRAIAEILAFVYGLGPRKETGP